MRQDEESRLRSFRSAVVRAKLAPPESRPSCIERVRAEAQAFLALCQQPDDPSPSPSPSPQPEPSDPPAPPPPPPPLVVTPDQRRAANLLAHDSQNNFTKQYTTNVLLILGVIGLLTSYASPW